MLLAVECELMALVKTALLGISDRKRFEETPDI